MEERDFEKTEDPVRAYGQALSFFKTQIAAGRLRLGDRLPSERALMAELGLSRSSVREALRQMENMGFVKSRHGQGSFLVNEAGKGFSAIFSMSLLLKAFTREEFLSLRRCLETASFFAAVQNPALDPRGIREMEEAFSEMEEACLQREGDCESQLFRGEAAFHKALIMAGGNGLFLMIMEALSALEDAYRRESLAALTSGSWRLLLEAHRNILEAVKNHREEEGVLALEEHFKLAAGEDTGRAEPLENRK